MKKNLYFTTILCLLSGFVSSLFAVEWPQEDYNNNAFNSYFGQNVVRIYMVCGSGSFL